MSGYSHERSRVLEQAYEKARREISRAVSGIDEHLRRLEPQVEKAAESISKGKPDDSALRSEMKRIFPNF